MKAKTHNNNNNWIPIEAGFIPEDKENVQVTFLGYNDHKPYCDAFAYIEKGIWYQTLDDSPVRVEITAWRFSCEPYRYKDLSNDYDETPEFYL